MQGIKRVKSKSKTSVHGVGVGREGGYSQKEVWNWLYLDEEGQEREEEVEGEKGVSVQFSPAEFLQVDIIKHLKKTIFYLPQATSRLAHLNLEGFERFVGSTIDRALAGARTKSSDPLEARGEEVAYQEEHQGYQAGYQEEAPIYLEHEQRDTDMYVTNETEGQRKGCEHSKSKVPRSSVLLLHPLLLLLHLPLPGAAGVRVVPEVWRVLLLLGALVAGVGEVEPGVWRRGGEEQGVRLLRQGLLPLLRGGGAGE